MGEKNGILGKKITFIYKSAANLRHLFLGNNHTPAFC